MIERLLGFIDSLDKKGLKWCLYLVYWVCIAFFTFFIFSVLLLNSSESYYFMLGTYALTVVSFYIIRYSLKLSKNILIGLVCGILVIVLFQFYTYYALTLLSINTKDIYLPVLKAAIGNLQYWEVFYSSKVFYYSYTLCLFHLFPPLGIWAFYELIKNFYQNQRLKEENLKLEISYLHAQINPHFLLNTLTAIYNMVMDNPKASKSIETLSGLLHYSLYDTGSEKVPLDKEVQFIKNYIKLARIRLNRNKKLKLTITGSSKGLTIAPLILVNLVENCIKHGLHRVSGAAEAEVIITIEKEAIYLSTYNITPDLSGTTGGIGLHNTRRRLNIYYPDKHELEIIDKNHVYRVNLLIYLMQ